MPSPPPSAAQVLRKERDLHRMHHKRIAQEKNTLVNELKRVRAHYAQYEPTIKELRAKYEVLMKEKMLTRLERDRVLARLQEVEGALIAREKARGRSEGDRLTQPC